MNHLTTVSTGILIGLSVVSTSLWAASGEEKAAQQAVVKIIKDPQTIKWGKFSTSGAKGACLTVYAKNSLTGLVGAQEAFLLRNENGWDALYIADIPSGHQGCIDEMSKR